jgi:polyphosphate kinase 2 (PPK2 family)
MQYYEEAINNTSTDYAPWYVIPADDKEMCRYIVGKIIWEEMQKHTDIQTPEMDDKIEKHRIVQEMLAKNKML